MRIWFLIFIIFSSATSYSQNKQITGSVLIDEGNEKGAPAVGIRIENTRTQFRTYSNFNGYYSIQATIGDTISYEADFVATRKIVINENIYKKGYLQVHLDIETIELGSVDVGKGPLKTKYYKDTKTDLYDKIGLDQRLRDLEPKRDIAKFKALDVLNPVRLLGHINGFYRNERRVKNYEAKISLIQEVKNYYPTDFYTTQLHIPEYKIEEFLYYVNARYPLREKVLNRQFGSIMIDLETYAKQYLKDLNQNK